MLLQEEGEEDNTPNETRTQRIISKQNKYARTVSQRRKRNEGRPKPIEGRSLLHEIGQLVIIVEELFVFVDKLFGQFGRLLPDLPLTEQIDRPQVD
jgi:hypothetical protein